MLRRHVVLPLSALALALVGLTAPAAASPPVRPSVVTPPASARPQAQLAATGPTAPAPTVQQVRLLGGDLVSVVRTPSGRIAPTVWSVNGSPVTVITTPTATYAFPHALRAVLGGRLDPSLFDVNALTAADASGLPVSVTYTSTSAPTAVPGVEILSRSGRTATGRVTPSSSAALGVALRTASASSLYGTVARVTATASAGVQPHFPMFTLTVNGVDAAGAPMSGGLAAIVNLDDMAKYVGVAFIDRGVAKVSVPAGSYAIVASSLDPTVPDRLQFALRSDVTVSGATSATIDARTATAPVRFATPKPATTNGLAFTANLTDAANTGFFAATVFGFGGLDLRVSPSARPRVGGLDWSALAHLESPQGVAPYTYDLERVGTGGIPSSLTFITRSADLSAVTASYYSPARALAMPSRTLIGTQGGGGFGSSVSVPLQRTEYVAAPPGTRAADEYFAEIDTQSFAMYGHLVAEPWLLQPGTSRTQTWNKAPLTPRLFDGAMWFGATLCPACVVGDQLSVLAHPFSDSDPTHIGGANDMTDRPRTSTSWAIALDGAVVANGEGELAATLGGASTASTVAVDYATDGRIGGATTPSHTVTHWDLPLAAARGLAPAAWQCWVQIGPADPPPSDCRVLPLMTVRYELPTDLSGRIPAGETRARLLVSHVDATRPIAVSTPTMDVSFDGGTTWQRARVIAEGSGNFTVKFTTPPATPTSRPAKFKVAITDALGGHFTELVTAAFTVR